MSNEATELLRLLQFSDSAFPVGSFSFSNGMETAAEEGLVRDAATLEEYTFDIVRQAAFTDGVAALHAYRSREQGRYDGIPEADRYVILCKMNTEARQMTLRMGKKLAELSRRILSDDIVERWLGEIDAGRTPGTYPVAQGILFAACGISERGLFCSQQYGTANMVLSAALRCVRVSHYDTQRILFDMSRRIDDMYRIASEMELDEMHAFAPQTDILASLHEKGLKRMFMN